MQNLIEIFEAIYEKGLRIMANQDFTLGKAIYTDCLATNYPPVVPTDGLLITLQAAAFGSFQDEAVADWVTLVEKQGGKLVDPGYVYEDWSGGADMDAKID
jgi:hypothetical protein